MEHFYMEMKVSFILFIFQVKNTTLNISIFQISVSGMVRYSTVHIPD